jgi:uncharacterized protein YpuA (DUF1002 family)
MPTTQSPEGSFMSYFDTNISYTHISTLLTSAASPPNQSVDWSTIVGISSGIISVILALFAIWLSLALYRMSTKASDSIEQASNSIGASIDRLNSLFDRLYSDLFSITRDTVTDMREHLWPSSVEVSRKDDQADEIASAKVDELKNQVTEQIQEAFDRIGLTDDRIATLQSSVFPLVNKALEESRSVQEDARQEALRRFILNTIQNLKRRRGRAVADDLVLRGTSEFAGGEIISEVQKLRDEGLVEWRGDAVQPDTEIRLAD